MNVSRKQDLALLRRVHSFLAAAPPAEPLATPLRELAAVIGRLEGFGARQEEHQRRMQALTTRLREQARRVRHDHMKSITLAARSVLQSDGKEAVALEQSVRLPRYRTDYEQIILAARGVAATVEPHQREIAATGLGDDFLTTLRAAADGLVAAVGARSQEFQRRVAATKGVEAEARRGIALVRLLDAIVRPTLRPDAPRLAEWERVLRRVARSTPGTPEPEVTPEVAPAQAA